jgi:hypothetical protein
VQPATEPLADMLTWLTNNFDLFGFSGQNWMWVIAAALALYFCSTLLFARRDAGTR